MDEGVANRVLALRGKETKPALAVQVTFNLPVAIFSDSENSAPSW